LRGKWKGWGATSRNFNTGDEVFGEIPGYNGGLAEYACVPERKLLCNLTA